MTTVAYNHRDNTISVDGMITANGTVLVLDYEKYLYDKGNLFFFCGRVCDYEKLISLYNGNDESGIEAGAILICNSIAHLVSVSSNGELEVLKLTYSHAIGRGDEVALTAMDYGATSREAVEAAARRTTTTGGKIRTYDITKARFLDD